MSGDHASKEVLEPLARAWRSAVRLPARRASLSLAALTAVVAFLAARGGTLGARAFAALLFAAFATASVLVLVHERRVWQSAPRTLRRLAARVDPAGVGKALRALSLTPDHGTSAPLAELHAQRAFAALPRERIVLGARRIGTRLGWFALGAASMVLVLTVVRGFRVIEGVDVFFARDGVAPVSMSWLDDVDLEGRPPDYLHEDTRHEPMRGATVFPRGTLLTVHGVPVHSGRALFLADGHDEVPFVDDGSGGLVARWPLAGSVTLRVLARFGQVVIEDEAAEEVTSIDDESPVVTLEGAPRRVELVRDDDGGDIALRYEATDDHGLREVHLVLRSGSREERRVLARLDGETRHDRGGHFLRRTDPFLKKSVTPVEVRVEAKDNDPITGPKWGASESITVIPPHVGEPEALRLAALTQLRDASVDALARRLETEVPKSAAERRALGASELRAADDFREQLEAVFAASYAGLRVPGRQQSLLRGEAAKLHDAEASFARGVTPHALEGLAARSEHFVSIVDAVVRGLALRDARATAKRLADVADDVANGARSIAATDEAVRGHARVDAGVSVLGDGGVQLRRLGELGRDLGEIVAADLLRFARAEHDQDWVHAELSARDLAGRLREPDPSFGGGKGKASRGGGESGGARGSPGDDADEAEGDEVQRAFDEAAAGLERLAEAHAGNIGKVEQALGGAASDEDARAMAEEGARHAEAVREATRPLPSVGGGSDSWTGKGAAAREHADQMAHGLEAGQPADAVASGHAALQALDEAKRAAARERWAQSGSSGADDGERRIDAVKKRLEPEVAWAERKLDELRKKAEGRAGSELRTRGHEEEDIADEARKLGERGQRGAEGGQLPAEASDALEAAERGMREAAEALRRGQADKALDAQREAQRNLEMARQAMGSEGSDGQQGDDGGDHDPALDHADIPKADAHKGPEEFRRRVLFGLGQGGAGRHQDAVRRYAEGLLR